MRHVEFQRFLSADNILRAWFELERGQVHKFMVQLECYIDDQDEWIPVVRYDTAHGFAHCDRLHPYAPTTKTKMTTRDYNEALTFAIQDLAENWGIYRRRFERWLRKK
jgi:hypothetical protein